MNDKLRRSGRTTRMLLHAIHLATERKAVYVLCADNHERGRLITQFLFHCSEMKMTTEQADALGVKFETPYSVNVSWTNMKLRGAHPNCVLLADHFTIEQHLGGALEMLHRYDP